MNEKNTPLSLTYAKRTGNYLFEGLAILAMLGAVLANVLLQGATAPKGPLQILFYASVALAVLTWVVNYILFVKDTNMHLIKDCSLQLILCGLLGTVLAASLKDALSLNTLTIVVILTVVMLICNIIMYRDAHSIFWITFLQLPYAVLSAGFFLVTGFISAFLLILVFFNGHLLSKDDADDYEYFGNSNHK